jgi:hypothetical protein
LDQKSGEKHQKCSVIMPLTLVSFWTKKWWKAPKMLSDHATDPCYLGKFQLCQLLLGVHVFTDRPHGPGSDSERQLELILWNHFGRNWRTKPNNLVKFKFVVHTYDLIRFYCFKYLKLQFHFLKYSVIFASVAIGLKFVPNSKIKIIPKMFSAEMSSAKSIPCRQSRWGSQISP